MRFECDQCGACCRQLIIEIQHLDVVREPRLLDHAKLCDGHGKITYEDDWEKIYMLACGETHPCSFLGADNRCAIYPTRPNCCVGMQAGDEQCQDARAMAGLPALAPTTEGGGA